MDDFAVGDRADFIERFAVLITMQRANVDTLMKTRINNAGARFHRIADETILATFPRCRFFTLIIALDVLIKIRTAAMKDRVVVGRQCKVESRRLRFRESSDSQRQYGNQNEKEEAHRQNLLLSFVQLK